VGLAVLVAPHRGEPARAQERLEPARGAVQRDLSLGLDFAPARRVGEDPVDSDPLVDGERLGVPACDERPQGGRVAVEGPLRAVDDRALPRLAGGGLDVVDP
jgi:hypothetical protein